jgi:hypothetical protein
MILSFSHTHPTTNKPTHFIEKVMANFYPKYREKYIPKIHTFREGSRWKFGDKIHFSTGMRTKSYRLYHIGRCLGIQWTAILIYPNDAMSIRIYDDPNNRGSYRELSFDQMLLYAANDGFDSLDEMTAWFFPNGWHSKKKDFVGQTVHFTDFKY